MPHASAAYVPSGEVELGGEALAAMAAGGSLTTSPTPGWPGVVAGGAAWPRTIWNAVHEGANAALEI